MNQDGDANARVKGKGPVWARTFLHHAKMALCDMNEDVAFVCSTVRSKCMDSNNEGINCIEFVRRRFISLTLSCMSLTPFVERWDNGQIILFENMP